MFSLLPLCSLRKILVGFEWPDLFSLHLPKKLGNFHKQCLLLIIKSWNLNKSRADLVCPKQTHLWTNLGSQVIDSHFRAPWLPTTFFFSLQMTVSGESPSLILSVCALQFKLGALLCCCPPLPSLTWHLFPCILIVPVLLCHSPGLWPLPHDVHCVGPEWMHAWTLSDHRAVTGASRGVGAGWEMVLISPLVRFSFCSHLHAFCLVWVAESGHLFAPRWQLSLLIMPRDFT